MADIKISELGAASAVNNTDLIPMTSAGVTVKATAQQFKNYMGVGNLADLTTDNKSSAVAAINEVNTKVSKTEVLISIVENGNTCTHAGGISKGQYVCWKGQLYTADSNISVGATFASSGGSKNLNAVSNGGLNDLNSKKLQLSSLYVTGTTDSDGILDSTLSNIGNISSNDKVAFSVLSGTYDQVVTVFTTGTGGARYAFRFTYKNGTPVANQTVAFTFQFAYRTN